MKKIEAIWNHPKFKHYLALNEEWEKDRVFCLHDKNHLIDVSRIGYILNLEQNLGFEKFMRLHFFMTSENGCSTKMALLIIRQVLFFVWKFCRMQAFLP